LNVITVLHRTSLNLLLDTFKTFCLHVTLSVLLGSY